MTRAPRVLHVLRSDAGGHVGGDLVQLGRTVEGLRSAGVDAVAATVTDAPDRVDVVHVYNIQRPAALARDVWRARRRWPDADVVLSPVWWPMQLGRMARSADQAVAAKGVKTGIKAIGTWPLLRAVLRGADVIAPNSVAERDAIARVFRLPDDDRWAVVPNGVDLSGWPAGRAADDERRAALTGLGLPDDVEHVLACVARIEPVKNQAAVVRALDHLPGAALVLVGPEAHEGYSTAVRQEIGQPRRAPRVVATGALPPDEIARLLRSVDVHVLASFRETPGLATLEAAAVGCEVVVTADGSAPEYLGPYAHVCDPFDERSIAEAVSSALDSQRQPALREHVGSLGWDAAADALIEAYRRLPAWRSIASS